MLLAAVKIARATYVTDVFHRFNPHGISGVVVIAESHLAIHTWPEHQIASIDFFSCSTLANIDEVVGFLAKKFHAGDFEVKHLKRGDKY